MAAHATGVLPLSGPATGSANPAASLTSLWSYIQPAADHLMRTPTNSGKAPALAVDYHMGIHTSIYNYFTTYSAAHGLVPAGADFYNILDGYFAEVARETLLGVSDEDHLIQYLLPCFNRYTAGASAVSRLLNYTNRQYVKRAIDEDRGWLRLADVIDDVADAVRNRDSHSKLAGRLRTRRDDELRRWGWDETPGDIPRAEAAAEAASAPDRIIPIASLAQRRFRIEVIEPLLMVPKAKKKNKGKGKAKDALQAFAAVSASASSAEKVGPKGRLARSVKALLEGDEVDHVGRVQMARELLDMLRATGVAPEQPLCRKLGKVVDAATTNAL